MLCLLVVSLWSPSTWNSSAGCDLCDLDALGDYRLVIFYVVSQSGFV